MRPADRPARTEGVCHGSPTRDTVSSDGVRTIPHRPAALVLQHGRLGPPGLLARWLRARADRRRRAPRRAGRRAAEPGRLRLRRLPGLGEVPEPPARRARARGARPDRPLRRARRPVLGLCFGGQALAEVLGGTVEVLDAPELGWHRVESTAPDVVAAGPVAAVALRGVPRAARRGGARALAGVLPGVPLRPAPRHAVPPRVHRRHRRAVGASTTRARLPGRLEDHLEHLRAGAAAHGAAAEAAAVRLFDAFWAGCPGAHAETAAGATRE